MIIEVHILWVIIYVAVLLWLVRLVVGFRYLYREYHDLNAQNLANLKKANDRVELYLGQVIHWQEKALSWYEILASNHPEMAKALDDYQAEHMVRDALEKARGERDGS